MYIEMKEVTKELPITIEDLKARPENFRYWDTNLYYIKNLKLNKQK